MNFYDSRFRITDRTRFYTKIIKSLNKSGDPGYPGVFWTPRLHFLNAHARPHKQEAKKQIPIKTITPVKTNKTNKNQYKLIKTNAPVKPINQSNTSIQ